MILRKLKANFVDMMLGYEGSLEQLRDVQAHHDKLTKENDYLRTRLRKQSEALKAFLELLEDTSRPPEVASSAPALWDKDSFEASKRFLRSARSFLVAYGEGDDMEDYEGGPDCQRRRALEDWVRSHRY